MLILLGMLTGHVILAGIVPSPWWVPDLTLIGLVVTISQVPQQWLRLSVITGLFATSFAIRCSGPLLVSYLGLGWMVQRLARRWDVTDLRVQVLVVSVGNVLITLGLLWLDELWSIPLLGLVAVRVMLTGLAVLCVRPLMRVKVG